MPKLIHFNSYTKFREAISFLGFSEDDDNVVVELETFTSDDGIVNLRMTTDRGISAVADATLKSECLECKAYVKLHDLCIMCDKGVKENDCAMWIADSRLYIGSCFNDTFNGFECECSIPFANPFELDMQFDKTDTISIEQSTMANISDSCFDFAMVEIWRIGGLVSFRTGDDRVSIATVANGAGGDPQVTDESLADISLRIPVKVFKVLGMTTDASSVDIDIDRNRKQLRVCGDMFKVTYSYADGEFKSDTTDGLTNYMKFDALSMMATVDMIYGINYLDPIAPVTLTPIDETSVSIEINNSDRYAATITMCGVRMYDTTKSIVLPMDIATMMISKCNCKTLTLMIGDNDKLFMCFQNKYFARKCMFFGN